MVRAFQCMVIRRLQAVHIYNLFSAILVHVAQWLEHFNAWSSECYRLYTYVTRLLMILIQLAQ